MSRDSPIRICRVQYEKNPCSAHTTTSAVQKIVKRLGTARVIVRQQKAQRNVGQPAELRQRRFRALDAVDNRADHQRQKRPGNSHPDLRDQADQQLRSCGAPHTETGA